jgi:hypothetical protein
MKLLILIEVVSGLVALILASVAFTNLSWAEGGSSQAMKRRSSARARGLFVLAGAFMAVAFLFAYLSTR